MIFSAVHKADNALSLQPESAVVLNRFRVHFFDWLDANLAARVPSRIRGLSFGLVAHELGYSVEMLGTSEFSAFGSHWTWSEAWEPKNRNISVSHLATEFGRDALMDLVEAFLGDYLETGLYSAKLKSLEGIGLGSLESEMRILWAREPVAAMRQLRSA